ncbi:MAG: hypothetical protein ACKVOY_21965 [Burkholderiaceae bacterium]
MVNSIWITPLCVSWVLGAALQLQQSSLSALEIDWLVFGVASIVFIFSLRFLKIY